VGHSLKLALPLLPATLLVNAAAPTIQFGAAQLGEGAVAIYGYASRLHGTISQILVMALSTVLLPHFAALWARGEKEQIAIVFRRIARCSVLVIAFVTIGIYFMGEAATQVLFQRGAFNATPQVSAVWFVLSLSLFPYAFGTFISKLCQAMRDGRSVFFSSLILFVTTWVVVRREPAATILTGWLQHSWRASLRRWPSGPFGWAGTLKPDRSCETSLLRLAAAH